MTDLRNAAMAREAAIAASRHHLTRGARARRRTRDVAVLVIVWALATAALSAALWPAVAAS